MKRCVVLAIGCLLLGLTSASAEAPNKKDLPKYVKELKAKDAKAHVWPPSKASPASARSRPCTPRKPSSRWPKSW